MDMRLKLTLADQELILGIRKDVVGLDHRGNVTSADSGIIGGLGRIPRRRGEDAEACDQCKGHHGDGYWENREEVQVSQHDGFLVYLIPERRQVKKRTRWLLSTVSLETHKTTPCKKCAQGRRL